MGQGPGPDWISYMQLPEAGILLTVALNKQYKTYAYVFSNVSMNLPGGTVSILYYSEDLFQKSISDSLGPVKYIE